MSTWEYEDYYTCLGECSQSGCNGHEYKLLINNTSDTYSFYHNGELHSSGTIEELNLIGSLMMAAGDAGVLS